MICKDIEPLKFVEGHFIISEKLIEKHWLNEADIFQM